MPVYFKGYGMLGTILYKPQEKKIKKCVTMKDQGGSRISGKGVYMYNGVGLALLILSHFP